MLGKCTSDYVSLRHEVLERHRMDTETAETLSVEVMAWHDRVIAFMCVNEVPS